MRRLEYAPVTQFPSPESTTAPAPAEARGLQRDQVRLLVATAAGAEHTLFATLDDHLEPGDLVVVNNSATVASQIDARIDGRPVVLHTATHLDDDTWVVEVRTAPDAAQAVLDAGPGQHLEVAAHLHLTLIEPYPREGSSPTGTGNRLWRARADGDLRGYLDRHGRAIAYGYLDRPYPLTAYQSVFSTVPGSAEMPSAGRPFTAGLVTRLVSRGVRVAPITLHTGVSSQEAGEAPQREWFEVPPVTADQVCATHRSGGRVVAVGTTVTRALESAAVGENGGVQAASGWTDHVVSPADPARVVDGLITGWHDPHASHLLLVESVAGTELTQRAYEAAVAEGYLWHEFGDSALFLPRR